MRFSAKKVSEWVFCLAESILSPVDVLPRPLEGIDEVFDLVRSEALAPILLTYDLEECISEDLKAALRVEDDLEPAEDAVRDADEIPMDGCERKEFVCGEDISLIHHDLKDRR